MFSQWQHKLWQPIDAAFLTFFRMAFGLIMMWEVWRYLDHDWIATHWIDPQFHFTYLGFGWVQPWGGTGMYMHFAGLGILALCIMLGIQYRLSAFLFWLGFTYVFLLEQSQYLNHFYLIALISFLLIFLPAERASSLDVYFNPEQRSDTVPRWTLWLLRFQIGLVYFYGGIAKLNEDWLRGEPMRAWLAERTDFPFIGSLFTQEWMVYAFSYGGLLLDLLVVPFLLWKRTRYAAFTAVVIFHLMNNRLFTIGIFPFMMIAATTVFFVPDWPKRLFGWRGESAETTPIKPTNQKLARLGTMLLSVFIVWQVLMPFRHFLYPSNVHWSEEGHRFAWHMKLRDKDAQAQFFVGIDGETRAIQTSDYLTNRQARKMASRPDMLLQFAHHLADEMGGDVVVQAVVSASLNGRPEQLLVEPTANLVDEVRSIRPKTWLAPLNPYD